MIAIVKVTYKKGTPPPQIATVAVMNARTLAGACNQASQLLVDSGLTTSDDIVDAVAFVPKHFTYTAAVIGIE